MNDSNTNDVIIDKNNIDEVYIDQERNIKITLKDHKKIIIQRSKASKEVYNHLSGYDADD